MLETGEVYMVKSRGPRTDPWGTPEVHGADVDECWPI